MKPPLSILLPPDENAVIHAICEYLSAGGYKIVQKLGTTEHGVDVIAEHPGTHVRALVEAKGGTSSRDGSERFGKPYTQTQVFDRVAKGIFTCLQMRTENPDKNAVRVILAVPEKPVYFLKYISKVISSLERAGIEVWYAKDL
jgi:predicted nuclease with RNAse H fold